MEENELRVDYGAAAAVSQSRRMFRLNAKLECVSVSRCDRVNSPGARAATR